MKKIIFAAFLPKYLNMATCKNKYFSNPSVVIFLCILLTEYYHLLHCAGLQAVTALLKNILERIGLSTGK